MPFFGCKATRESRKGKTENSSADPWPAIVKRKPDAEMYIEAITKPSRCRDAKEGSSGDLEASYGLICLRRCKAPSEKAQQMSNKTTLNADNMLLNSAKRTFSLAYSELIIQGA